MDSVVFFMFLMPSAVEGWSNVPLLSFYVPTFGFFLNGSPWTISVLFSVLTICVSHSLNHWNAQAGTSGISGVRLFLGSFWGSQILERVQIKWRAILLRSSLAVSHTNRLTSGWICLSDIQRKASWSWVVVLFFVLVASNAFGLVPLFSAVTGQAGTTLGLSFALWAAICYAGVVRLGKKFVKLFLPSGPSWPMAPVFVLLESISYSFRAISLGVRLWANLFAGHQLLHLFTSLFLIPIFSTSFVFGAPIVAIGGFLLMALSALETIVCVLQSGVFCLLCSFYLNEALSKKDSLGATQSGTQTGVEEKSQKTIFPAFLLCRF